MKYSLSTLLLVLTLFIFSCKSETKQASPKKDTVVDVFGPKLVAINVSDIRHSAYWYEQRLGFEIENPVEEYPEKGLKIAILKKDNIRLELLEMAHSKFATELLNDPTAYLGGISKIGLSVGNIQKEYNKINDFGDVNFASGIAAIPDNPVAFKWPTKYFIITDPTSNYIQYFDSGIKDEVSPWLFMITVKNLDEAIDWYVGKLGFNPRFTIGEPGNRRSILERNNYVIELFEPSSVLTANELPEGVNTFGIKKLAFRVKDIDYLSSDLMKKDVKVVMPLSKSDLDWCERTMIIEDLEGNFIQLMEMNE